MLRELSVQLHALCGQLFLARVQLFMDRAHLHLVSVQVFLLRGKVHARRVQVFVARAHLHLLSAQLHALCGKMHTRRVQLLKVRVHLHGVPRLSDFKTVSVFVRLGRARREEGRCRELLAGLRQPPIRLRGTVGTDVQKRGHGLFVLSGLENRARVQQPAQKPLKMPVDLSLAFVSFTAP